ncbi:antifungal protein ginkbilobin-like protein [Rhodamnia argentea]|uniref:Antifungal protein ginkbilobin-like protein n=1 Tax=Rhodamnia argentea TaxID=178133 RepID=A0A8B8PLF9_9MYRT|nr:antifungal protein ginkbilobin-like protein [Rhodamnia argentea]
MASFPMIALIVGGLLHACNIARGVPDTTLVQKTCNGEKNENPSAYCYNVQNVVSDWCSNTPSHGYDYYDQFSFGGRPCYGHGSCNGGLTNEDCSECLVQDYYMMRKMCDLTIGVQFELKDCRLRYENYYFVE